MKNILVGIEFHDNIDLLVDKSIELAQAFNAKVWLVHIAAPEPDFVGYDVGPVYIRDFRAKELRKEHKLLLEYTNKLKEKEIDAEGLLVQGPTIDMLFKEAKKLKIDLIVTGHHAHSALYNFFFDNTTVQLIKDSDLPVLVVPLGE